MATNECWFYIAKYFTIIWGVYTHRLHVFLLPMRCINGKQWPTFQFLSPVCHKSQRQAQIYLIPWNVTFLFENVKWVCCLVAQKLYASQLMSSAFASGWENQPFKVHVTIKCHFGHLMHVKRCELLFCLLFETKVMIAFCSWTKRQHFLLTVAYRMQAHPGISTQR